MSDMRDMREPKEAREAEARDAEAFERLAVAIGALRALLEPPQAQPRVVHEVTPAERTSTVTQALDQVVAASVAAGYTWARVLELLAQMLRPTARTQTRHLATAWSHLAHLRGQELGRWGAP